MSEYYAKALKERILEKIIQRQQGKARDKIRLGMSLDLETKKHIIEMPDEELMEIISTHLMPDVAPPIEHEGTMDINDFFANRTKNAANIFISNELTFSKNDLMYDLVNFYAYFHMEHHKPDKNLETVEGTVFEGGVGADGILTLLTHHERRLADKLILNEKDEFLGKVLEKIRNRKEIPNVEINNQDLVDIRLEPNSVTVARLPRVLYHVKNNHGLEGVKKVLSTLKTGLKPGGSVEITLADGALRNPDTEFENTIKNCGLKVVEFKKPRIRLEKPI